MQCNAMQWAALATISLCLQVSGTETVQCECVCAEELFFFLSAGEKEREGEQVLLT
jgi:hypothetical protein